MRLELQIKTSDCSRNLPAIGAYQSGCSIYISNASQLLENEVVQFYWPFVGRFSTCSHQFIRLFTSPPTRVFSHLTLSTAIKLLCTSSIRQLLSLKDLSDALSMLFSFDLHLPVAFSVSLLYFEFLLRFSASFSAQFSISLSPSRILILWPFIADKLSKLMPNWQTSLMALVKLIHRFRSLLLGIDLNIGIMWGTRGSWNGTPEHSEAILLNSLNATEIGCYRAISRDKVECSSVSTSSSADWLPREGVVIQRVLHPDDSWASRYNWIQMCIEWLLWWPVEPAKWTTSYATGSFSEFLSASSHYWVVENFHSNFHLSVLTECASQTN